jgi:hypothetical protein
MYAAKKGRYVDVEEEGESGGDGWQPKDDDKDKEDSDYTKKVKKENEKLASELKKLAEISEEFNLFFSQELKKDIEKTPTAEIDSMYYEEEEFNDADYEYELLRFEETYDGRLAILQAALTKEEISYTEYAERVKQLDRDIAINKLDATSGMFSEMANLLGGFAKTQKASILFQLFADQASAISSLMKMSEANPANVVTGGLAATLQFGAGIIRIGANFAKAFGALKQAKEADVQKQAAATTVRQYASGRYNVVGAEDNRLYRNVPYIGNMRTGLQVGPALVSEQGNEFIVNANDMRNPVVANYTRAIAREVGAVKQYATGKYDTATNNTPDLEQLSSVVMELRKAVAEFPRTVKAKMSYFDDFKPIQNEVENNGNELRF